MPKKDGNTSADRSKIKIKKQFTEKKPCAILVEVKKARIQKPDTPTTS